MLDHISISNYRCFQSVEVPLKPLTVLIGENNTGKSAFLSSIQLLGDKTLKGNSGSISIKDRWLFDRDFRPSILGSCQGGGSVQVAPFERAGNKVFNTWELEGDVDSLSPISLFGADSLVPAMQCKAVTEAEGIPLIDDKATNVPAVLDAMLRKDRPRFLRIVDLLKDLIPGFEDINIETPKQSHVRIDLRLENDLILQGSDASYGVRLLLFFVTLANHPKPPKTILVEEPENGVHPKRLGEIVELLRGLTTGRYSSEIAQVIITTHSPYLLDTINIETDQVLVAQRMSGGQRTIQPIDTDRLKGFLEHFKLGEVWSNQEEAGLIAKREEVTG